MTTEAPQREAVEAKDGAGTARRTIITLLLLLLLVLVVDGLYVGAQLAGNMLGVADDLQTGADQLREGNLQAAEEAFANAGEAAKNGGGLLNHPAPLIARILPYVGSEIDAVDRLMKASEQTSGAGVAAVDGARELGLRGDEEAAEALIDAGQVDVDLLETASPHISEAAESLEGARELLVEGTTPRSSLLQEAYLEAKDKIVDASETATDASNAVRLLPELLGGKGKRRYFLAFQAAGDPRATGGFIGVYGILEANNGRMHLAQVDGIEILSKKLKGSIKPPPNISQHDVDSGATKSFPQANIMPHWPTAARTLIAMYEKAEGERLDGAIGMDQVALANLMRDAPPINVPDLGIDVTSENVVDVISQQSYTELTELEQTAVLVALVRDFWAGFSEGTLPPESLAAGMGDAIDTRHLKVFSANEEAADALHALQADDDFTSYGEDVQIAHINNYGQNKIGPFIQRGIDTNVEKTDDESVLVTTNMKIDNSAPTSPVTLLNLPFPGEKVGTFDAEVCFVLPAGAEWESFQIDGEKYPKYGDKELGRLQGCGIIFLESGKSTDVTVSYRMPELESLVLYPQAQLNPDTYRVTGYDGEVHEGTLEEPVEIGL